MEQESITDTSLNRDRENIDDVCVEPVDRELLIRMYKEFASRRLLGKAFHCFIVSDMPEWYDEEFPTRYNLRQWKAEYLNE
jgi:hypothetical protein